MSSTNDKDYLEEPIRQSRIIAYIGLFVAIITVCTYISIPAEIPFTLQTMAIFLALGILGGKRGTIAIICYVVAGTMGLPVFAGFKSGPSALFGPTGGFLIGFVLCGILYWSLEGFFGKSIIVMGLSMLAAAVVYFFLGTFWYAAMYLGDFDGPTLLSAFNICTLPFIIPDLIKLGIALPLAYKLRNLIKS